MAMPKQAKLWVVNIVSFVLFSLLAVTGLTNWLVLPHGGGRRESLLIETRHLIRDVHAWLAVFFLVVIVIHLLLHWPYIRSNFVKMGWFGKK
jgi:hypothetical protein